MCYLLFHNDLNIISMKLINTLKAVPFIPCLTASSFGQHTHQGIGGTFDLVTCNSTRITVIW